MHEWTESRLEELADISSGGTPSRTNPGFWGSDVPWATPSDISACQSRTLFDTRESISLLGLNSSSAKLLPKGALLVTSRATIGEVRIAARPIATNQGFKNLVPNSRVNGDFLYYQLMRLRGRFERYAAGSTFPEINRRDTGRVLVPYPTSKKLQEKIANILKTIDQAIEHTTALIDKYQQIKAGLMHDLFTRGIGADGKLRPPHAQAPELYQQTPIGWIPRDWQYELLDSLAERGSGHTPSKSHPEYWGGGIKWVSLADSFRLDDLYIEETEHEISTEGLRNSSAVLHPAGSVIMSRDAGVGKSAITRSPMAVSQHFMCWRCDKKMDNHFLYYWLQHNKRNFENIAMGSTILTIGLSYFKRLKVACPTSKAEQVRIGGRLKAMDGSISTLKSELSKLKEQKLGLMHDLLTGKVQVTSNTDTKEAADVQD